MEIILRFNKKPYSVPIDIQEYLEILNLTDHIHRKLLASFLKKTNSDKYYAGIIPQSEMQEVFEKASEKYIEKLCKKGIYDQTINNYIFDNQGYKNYIAAYDAACQTIEKYSSDQYQDYQEKAQSARHRAVSQVTGSGVSVYSNSFLTLAMSSAVEYSTLKGQYNKANEQYNKELRLIQQKGNKDRKQKELYYYEHEYRPNIEKALLDFSFELMQKYLECLIENKLFDVETLKFANLDFSRNILRNLTLSTNKDAVLEKAFLACPFNIDVYVELGKLGKLDADTFKTAEALGQSTYVEQDLYKLFKKSQYSGNLYTDLASLENIIISLANITETPKEAFYKEFATPIYTGTIEKYKSIKKYVANPDDCIALLGMSDDKILSYTNKDVYLIAERKVKSIISEREFESVTTKGGYNNFLADISPTDKVFSKKSDLDQYYTDRLYINLTQVLLAQQKSIIDRKQQEEDRKTRELSEIRKKKHKVIGEFVASLVIPLALVWAFSSLFTNIQKKNIENYLQLKIGEASKYSAHWDAIGGIKSFEIDKIKYSIKDRKIYIKIDTTYTIGSNLVDDSSVKVIIDGLYSDYSNSNTRLLAGKTTVQKPNGQRSEIELRSKKYADIANVDFNFSLSSIGGICYCAFAIIVLVYLLYKLSYLHNQEKKYS